MKRSVIVGLMLTLMTPAMVLAHTGATPTAGFVAGFSHPVGGFDHLLAMLAVGLWAACLGGRSLWLVPSAFVAVMLVGGGLGNTGVELPFVEQGILASVLILGFLTAAALKTPTVFSIFIVGVFALFHGHAHGTEIPVAAGAITYSAGFALSTLMLHMIGLVLGSKLQGRSWWMSRLAGGVILFCGLCLTLT